MTRPSPARLRRAADDSDRQAALYVRMAELVDTIVVATTTPGLTVVDVERDRFLAMAAELRDDAEQRRAQANALVLARLAGNA